MSRKKWSKVVTLPDGTRKVVSKDEQVTIHLEQQPQNSEMQDLKSLVSELTKTVAILANNQIQQQSEQQPTEEQLSSIKWISESFTTKYRVFYYIPMADFGVDKSWYYNESFATKEEAAEKCLEYQRKWYQTRIDFYTEI